MINLLSSPGKGWSDGGGGAPASQPSEYGRSRSRGLAEVGYNLSGEDSEIMTTAREL